jgi:7-carboxy-7-deazaguanine synthase
MSKLPVMEHFYTIQGEGIYTGHAAYFIRLAGCDVGCHWCDVKESWNADEHRQYEIDEMVSWVAQSPAPMVVITGGEPLMHPLDELTRAIRALGKRTHLETSAAYPISGKWDWVCVSPKKFKAPRPEVLLLANELKVVINHPSDFEFAQLHAQGVNPQCKLLLQAEWSKESVHLPKIIDFCKTNPQFTISLQTHKYLNIP